MKKIVSIMITVLLLLLLSGCGSNAPNPNGSSMDGEAFDEQAEAPEQYICKRIVYRESGQIETEFHYACYDNEVVESERIEYHYREDGLPLSIETFYDAATEPQSSENYQYDENGNLISVERNGEVIEEYKYDEAGNCILQKTDHYGSPRCIEYTYNNGVLVSSYEEVETEIESEEDDGYHYVSVNNYYYTDYDSKGRPLIQKCFVTGEDPYEDRYEYRADGYSIKTYDLSGDLLYTENVKTDASGRVLMRESLPNYESDWGGKTEYQYEGTTTTITSYDSNGELKSTGVTTADEYGNLITSKHYDAEGTLISSYEYQYDSNLHVTRSVVTQNGETTIAQGPERTYYSNGAIKEIVIYSGIDYINPYYYTETPKDEAHSSSEWW